MTEPKDILVWAQVGGQMVQLATTAFSNLKGMLTAAGADEADLNAALDRTHALYQAAIAREQALLDSGAMKTMVLIFALLVAAPAFAQTPVPTNYTFTTHFEATPDGAPISSFDFAKTAAQCDQPVVAVTGVQANPRFIRWTDPERPTRDCVLDTGTTTGVLFAMPFGGRYIAKLTAKVTVGGIEFGSATSTPSNPFVRGAAPATAVAVRVGG